MGASLTFDPLTRTYRICLPRAGTQNPFSMRKLSTLRKAALLLAVAGSTAASAQLFEQNFSASTTTGTYVSGTPNNGQFDALNVNGSTAVTINTTGGNKLRYTRTGNSGGFSRITDFSGPPTSLMIRFDMTLSGTQSAATTGATWWLGSGFATANSGPANANVHSRVGLNVSASTGQFSLRDITGSTNSSTYSGTQTITWVVNNSGASITYRAPNGANESIADDTWDLWVGNTKEFDEISALFATQTLADFKFLWTNGNGVIDFDNMLVDPIPAIPTIQSATVINANDFTANWTTVSGVTGYSIDVATDAAFTTFVSGFQNHYVSGQATSSVLVNGLNPTTPYWYRVRGTSQYTVGLFSSGNSGSANPSTVGGSSTSVSFGAASSSIAENVGPASLAITVNNPDPLNATNITVTAAGATGRIGSFTSPVIAAGGATSVNLSVPIANNILCDGNEAVTFTITGVTGGTGTPSIGGQNTHVLTVNNEDACTNVSFAASSATVNEGVGTYNVTLNITDFSPSQATSVDVVLLSGSAARIANYTTQTVTFPANSGAAVNLTLTVTDNNLCDGSAVLTFALQNLTGGQNTPTVGGDRTLTITDNEVPAPPVATAATAVGPFGFSANWNPVVGATGYHLDVFTGFNSGLLAQWTFPTSGTVVTPDVSIPANSSRTLSTVGTNAITSSAGAATQAASATGWDGGNGTKYWMVDFSTAGYGGITVSSAQRASGSGPRDFKVQYRIGLLGTWTDVSGGTVTVADNFTSGVLSALPLPSACNNQAQVFIRWIMTSNTNTGGGGVASTGTSRIDNIVINAVGNRTYVSGYNNYDAGTSTSVVVPGLAVDETYYYVVRATGGCATAGNSNEIEVTTAAVPNYYSRGTGSVSDPIWSNTSNGTAGPAIWSSYSSMIVQTGNVIDVDDDITINDLTVDAGGQVVVAAATTFTISGDLVDVDGTFTGSDNSTVLLNSPALVTMESASTLDLFDLTVNAAGDVLSEATIHIRGTLLLLDGDFDTDLGTVVLTSTASGTGRLGPITGAAGYFGDITVQRYIPTGPTNWRFLGSPVAGQTVNDWKDDFYTAGFPGSHSPTFSNPVGSGIRWPSVRWYDESHTFAHADSGWVGVSSTAQALEAGQGFAAWCGTGLTTTAAFTIDVTGEPNIALTPITRALDYTNTGNATIDGYNAVANPLPSPVLFSRLTRTGAVGDRMYIFNPRFGNVAVYDLFTNVGSLGGNDTIQSSQAFMVQTTATGASISFEEADKVADRQGGFFGGSQQNTFSGVRLNLTSGINGFADEAVVVFGAGNVGVDAADAPKMTFAHPDAPQIATFVGEQLFAINAMGEHNSALSIPVMVNASITGTYTVTASDMHNIGLTCLVIEDLLTGTRTPLVEGASYSFAVQADANSSEPRLILHASAPVPVYADAITCHDDNNGRGTVVYAGTEPLDITWTTATGEVLLQQTITDGVAIFNDLAAGTYGVSVSSTAGCGALSTTFTIEEPAAFEITALDGRTSCPDAADGMVDLTVLGGTAPYTYTWSDGSTGEDLVAAAGLYTVTIVDANGCTTMTPELSIAAGEGPTADATPSTTTTLVNTPIGFVNNSSEGESYLWQFGDGEVSTEYTPEHTYTAPGTYTVTLTVDNGNCTATWTAQVVVETSTSISSTTAMDALNAWFANDKFVVEHSISNGLPVTIDVLDATGRLHMARQVAGSPARVSLPAEGLSTGIWFVRIQNNNSTRTMRVPVVR